MPRKKRSELSERRCANCGRWFTPTTPKQIYHSEACRAQAYRKRKNKVTLIPYNDPSPWGNYIDTNVREV